MTLQPHKHFISGLWTPGPPCRSSGASPLTCHISLESAGLGPVVVGRGPLRQQVDGLAKPLHGCAEVTSLGGHYPLQLQGLGLLQLCSWENAICVREGARRGQVCSWEQEAKAPSGFRKLGPEQELARLGCRPRQGSRCSVWAGGAEVTKAES